MRALLLLSAMFQLFGAQKTYAGASAEWKGMERFRSLFYANARAAQFKDEDIAKLIFRPKVDFFERPIQGKTTQEALANRSKLLRELRPTALYENGRELPPPIEIKAGEPVTLIILPGIFGEFIDHTVYEELLTKDSAFAREWKKIAAEIQETDSVYDLESMTQKEQALGELFIMGSIDDDEGRPLTRVILLKAPKAALETLGTLPETAALYKNRLNKLFAILGQPQNAYLMGYSRGLNVGMEMLATLTPKEAPWLAGTKGLIGLGGVTYGSAAADLASDETTVEGQIMKQLLGLADSLEIPADDASLISSAALILKNTKKWADTFAEVNTLAQKIPVPEGLSLEKISPDGPNLGFFLKSFQQIALDKFQLDKPFAEYRQNIQRFRVFSREASEGLATLTTQNCLSWIQTHRLPEHYLYFAITATMPDPSSEDEGVSSLTANPIAFQPEALDYSVLRPMYYAYLEYSGMMANDSQTSLDRSPFWPELHQLANSGQKPFNAQLLAVLGSDHWGMAFPVAFETNSQKTNPFPRTVLIKTLGDFLRDQTSIF